MQEPLTPPDELEEYKECPECKGDGVIKGLSNCCAAIIEHDICTKCHEHCIDMDCGECLGTGQIPKEIDDFTDYEDALLDKSDEKYDESKFED